ncbi:pseudouridine synthase [Teredinibacter purpureus]|uniref:pseudouridine synthase n=1 Tax=Teredinibacter purpureus TaxID=2731756 RepID=UPI0005F7B504|nr:pseudouridine synthase [Teredinibacter purpureus]
MRLDKYIAANTPRSRAEVSKLVRQGAITVNGARAIKASQHFDERGDTVMLLGETVKALGETYLMLHKPAGYICANSDAEHPTVIDLLIARDSKKFAHPLPIEHLQIVGRLDIDTTGLVLMTTNGDWNHTITAPNKKCLKGYSVETAEPIDESLAVKFLEGIQLNNEKHLTKPAILRVLGNTRCELDISEGKYHQVKRMFAACNNRVTSLHRYRIGPITLDTHLEEGDFRLLTPSEIALNAS